MRSEDEILKDIFVAKRLGKPVAPLFEELQKQRCSNSERYLIEPQPTGSDLFLVALVLYPLLILIFLVIGVAIKTLLGGG